MDRWAARPDALQPFRATLVALRWGTVGLGLAFANERFRDHPTATATVTAVLVAWTVLRTIRPLHDGGGRRFALALAADAAVAVVATAATGGWSSPLAFSVVVPPMAAGFARGMTTGMVTGVACVVATELGDLLGHSTPARAVADAVVLVVMASVLAGYVHRFIADREEERSHALERIGRLADANRLLTSLHQVAQSLPTSLDVEQALDSATARLREVFDQAGGVAVLLVDDTDGSVHVVRDDPGRPLARYSRETLPPALAAALDHGRVAHVEDLREGGGPGLSPMAASGLYAALVARGATVGLVAVEHVIAGRYSTRDAELLEGLVDAAALAIDNARLFARLRTVGADEERSRIARELHDRLGQSLTFLAFELDRLVKAGERGDDLLRGLHQLRGEVRSVLREVRETLYDLRTDVSAARSFEEVLEGLLERVRERSGLAVVFDHDAPARLPLPQERELLRIAQEAIVNVERHAEATAVTVRWRCQGDCAELEVADNGHGFDPDPDGRPDAYGLVGMRERASSIGAALEVRSTSGGGTTVRCVVAPALAGTGAGARR